MLERQSLYDVRGMRKIAYPRHEFVIQRLPSGKIRTAFEHEPDVLSCFSPYLLNGNVEVSRPALKEGPTLKLNNGLLRSPMVMIPSGLPWLG